MSASQYPLHSPSPLDRLAGSYVELDDLKWPVDDKDAACPRSSQPPLHNAPAGGQERPDVRQDDDSGWWMFELFAWVVSIIALTIIVVTIAITDGKPLPRWPLDITLNSFVSFMSTIMKAALIIPVAEGISQLKWLWFKRAGAVGDVQTFDEASRGSWGSMKLIFATRGVHLAKLGAFITIVALGVDPFIQQVITYPSRNVASTSQYGSVPVVQSYMDYAYGAIMALREPTLAMKAAINNGLYDTNNDPQDDFAVSISCATGDCTWPDTYYSLAVCYKCANTTLLINKNCTDVDEPWGYCEYSLPNGLYFDGSQRGRLYMNSTGGLPTINFNNTQSTISSISTMRGIHDLSSTTLLEVVSNECVLYFCVNEYSAVVKDSEFTETIVATYVNKTDPVVGENITIAAPKSNQTFTVGATAWYALSLHFSIFWTGNVTGATGEISTSRSDDVLTALYQLGDDESGTGAQKLGGENDTIAAVAASMTRILRGSSAKINNETCSINNSTSGLACGTVWMVETYVHVRWPWMVLPIALEGLALVFLVCTIIKSKSSGVALWKSSTLPLLQGKLRDAQDVWTQRR
ncbi:uncharacterized protein BCR38DRAFT_487403 [Pseudomassariella vexata]|uniref:Uncharacterized protein n=1 Tax=Pseudomassariella vexata TaxID=1141098 RepID=A0A1Y2DR50_9PEZI|nr:uncharacterized protein BCR38DRAFT_487403 [Pseudomassariella vexata]ORY61659.1 hypothetical protein BCR38DRAFT_487403 [Pseudomassariella vexata]